jgi:hypothetical protein
MADESSAPKEKAQPAWMKPVVIAGVALLLLVLVQWAGSQRTENVRLETFARGTDALSGALAQGLLENNAGKLQTTVQRIATESGYEKVTVTNLSGVVVASTDRIQADIPADFPLKSKVTVDGNRLRAVRAIVLAGDTRLGGLEIVTRR